MKMLIQCLLLAVSLAGTTMAQDGTTESREKPAYRVESGIMVEMRDGVHLSTDLFFPEGATGKLPVILWRSVYGKRGVFENEALFAALMHHGYAVATQYTRGRGDSEGNFVPTIGDRNDSYDTVTWLIAQPWSDRKVGTAGCSIHGEAQLLLAAARHPNHVAAVPQASASAYHVHGRPWASYDGGVFELAQTAGWFAEDPGLVDFWTLPIIDVLKKAHLTGTEYENFASSNPDGKYFRDLEWIHADDRLDVPALFFDSWYDYGVAETLELFNVLQNESVSKRARESQFVIIAPSTHCGYGSASANTIIGERDLGDARIAGIDLQIRWFDYWMKGIDNGITDMPRVRYYLMGSNVWKSAPAWPVPGTQFEKLFLGSDGKANSSRGDGTLSFKPPAGDAADTFTYDPGSPVPTLGGQTCCTGTDTASGSYDQVETESRGDVLVYTSGVLRDGIEVTGPLQVLLHVSSSAKDTDFTAKLVDVYPDGRAFNIQDGALRMRYRDGFDKDLRMQPGEVYEARISLHATSNYFGPGHRIRLEISSSNFPRWDRNLNTGGNNYDESAWVVAENTVHHSAGSPSYILLPILGGVGPLQVLDFPK